MLSLANWCPPQFASKCMSQTSELVSRFHKISIETHPTVYRTMGRQNQQFVCSFSLAHFTGVSDQLSPSVD